MPQNSRVFQGILVEVTPRQETEALREQLEGKFPDKFSGSAAALPTQQVPQAALAEAISNIRAVSVLYQPSQKPELTFCQAFQPLAVFRGNGIPGRREHRQKSKSSVFNVKIVKGKVKEQVG